MSAAEIVARATVAIGAPQGELGNRLGLSRRTIVRWTAGETSPVPAELRQLAALVHPHDAELAAAIAAHVGESLETLGIAPPAPDPPLPAPRVPPPPPVVDAVICAAAESMDLSPRAVRGGVLAAFQRAHELGFRIDEVIAALRAAEPPGPAR
jgi:hypothetical protein